MEIYITGHLGAQEIVPIKPTLAIRIISPIFTNTYLPLKKSDNWVKILEYQFDDIYPSYLEDPKLSQDLNKRKLNHLFNQEIAIKSLEDFKRDYKNAENVLLHCHKGKSRSPAYAEALNLIFNLGYPKDYFRDRFPRINTFVLETMLGVAKQTI